MTNTNTKKNSVNTKKKKANNSTKEDNTKKKEANNSTKKANNSTKEANNSANTKKEEAITTFRKNMSNCLNKNTNKTQTNCREKITEDSSKSCEGFSEELIPAEIIISWDTDYVYKKYEKLIKNINTPNSKNTSNSIVKNELDKLVNSDDAQKTPFLESNIKNINTGLYDPITCNENQTLTNKKYYNLWKILKNDATKTIHADQNIIPFALKEPPSIKKNEKEFKFTFKKETIKDIDKQELSQNGLLFIRYDNCKIRNYNKDKDPTMDYPENGCYNLMYDIIEFNKCKLEDNGKCDFVNENKPTDTITFNYDYIKESNWLSKLFGLNDRIKALSLNYIVS